MGTLVSVLWKTTTFSTWVPASRRLIHQGLYAHFLATSHPAVRGEDEPRSAWSSRSVTASGPKPEKMGIAITPIFRHANMAKTVSGIMGMKMPGAVSGAHPHLAHGVR